ESLGHIVEEAEPAIDGKLLARCYMGMYYGQVAAMLARLRREHGSRDRDFHPDTRAIAAIGRAMSAGAYVELREHWNGFARALGAFFTTYDLYLTPTTALGPARIGELDSPAAIQAISRLISRANAGGLLIRSGVVEGLAFQNLERTPFTQLANLAFVPAMSVPLHQGPDGLPIGVQFVGRTADEATLLRLAAQLEAASPWAGRRPQGS
ncbi:MAG: amidase, partial [Acidiphilium sp. 37-67-22]